MQNFAIYHYDTFDDEPPNLFREVDTYEEAIPLIYCNFNVTPTGADIVEIVNTRTNEIVRSFRVKVEDVIPN